MEIHQFIKDRRALLGITQQDLADISGVGLRTIKLIETGKGNPALHTLQKVVEVLGMELVLKIKNTDSL